MRLLLSVAAAFVCVLPLRADITIDGEKKVLAHGFAELTVKGANNVVWQVTPDPVKASRRAGYLYLGGVPGTTYKVSAVVVDFEKKTIEAAEVSVTFEAEPAPVPPPGPQPPPPPGPNPPPPASDLTAKLAAQIKADGVDAETVKTLADAMAPAAEDANISAHATPRALLRQMRTVVVSVVTNEKADNLRALVDNEINKAVKGKEDSALTDEIKAIIKAVITKIVEALLSIIKK